MIAGEKTYRELEAEVARLRGLLGRCYLRVSLDEPVAYVGCYVLKWGKCDEPEYGFREVNDGDIQAALEAK